LGSRECGNPEAKRSRANSNLWRPHPGPPFLQGEGRHELHFRKAEGIQTSFSRFLHTGSKKVLHQYVKKLFYLHFYSQFLSNHSPKRTKQPQKFHKHVHFAIKNE
jgi:hypothetical protein